MTTRSMKGVVMGALLAAAALGPGLAHAVGVPGQGTWETTLLPRDLDGIVGNGPEAFYDTMLNVTWLRNANVNGGMNWDTAMTWANSLVVGGVGGWRLPSMLDTGTPGCNFSYAGGTDCGYNVQTASSEFAHLFYVTLGNLAYCPPGDATCAGGPQPGYGMTNTGGFQNMFSFHWLGLEDAATPSRAWYFYGFHGFQGADFKTHAMTAMAVRPGDVAAIPEPQTYALMLMGVAALMLAIRRRPI